MSVIACLSPFPPHSRRPAPGNARIAIKAVGICRSDVHYLERVRDPRRHPVPTCTLAR